MFTLAPEFDPFLKTWRSLPRVNHPALPARNHISPARFCELLQDIGLAERHGHQDLRMLFFGSGIENISGMMITGKNYYDILPPEFVKPTAVFHAHIFDTPCGAYLEEIVHTDTGGRYVQETVQLPVTDEYGVPRYLLVYGRGNRPLVEKGDRNLSTLGRTGIKEMHYLDIGVGAPKAHIRNFIFHNPA